MSVDSARGFARLRRFLSRLFLGLAVLFAIYLVFRWEENWRAARLLARTEAQLQRKGEQLDLGAFVPAPVPDAQNFAAAPIVVKLLSASQSDGPKSDAEGQRLEAMTWSRVRGHGPQPARGDAALGRLVDLCKWNRFLNGEQVSPGDDPDPAACARQVLQWFTEWSPEMTDLAAAAERPAAHFPVHYEKGPGMDFTHGTVLLRMSGLYSLRAIAALRAGDSALAYRDLETLNRLQEALQPEPLLISELVRLTILAELQQPLWEGLVNHKWNAGQLRQIQDLLEPTNLLSDHQRIVRGDRAFSRSCFQSIRSRRSHVLEKMHNLLPFDTLPVSIELAALVLPGDAVLDQNEAISERWVQDLVLPMVDLPGGRIVRENSDRLERTISVSFSTPYNTIAKLAFPIYPTIVRKVGAAAAALDEARAACAIERFRLENNRLPRELRELVPTYLAKVPADVLGQKELQYRPSPDGNYRIYSIGWNQLDDAGTIALKSNSTRRDDEKGDWVWWSAPR